MSGVLVWFYFVLGLFAYLAAILGFSAVLIVPVILFHRRRERGERRKADNPLEQRYFTLAPTTVSHCLVTTSLPAACSSSVGKTAFS